MKPEWHGVETAPGHPFEDEMSSADLEARGEDVERGVVERVCHSNGIDRAQRDPSWHWYTSAVM